MALNAQNQRRAALAVDAMQLALRYLDAIYASDDGSPEALDASEPASDLQRALDRTRRDLNLPA